MASQVSAPAVPAPAAPEPAHDNFLFRLLTENFDEGQVVRELHQKEKENPGTLSTIVTLKHKIYVLANYNSKVDTIKADRDIIDLIRFVFNKQFSEYLDTIKELAERIKTNAVIFNDAALEKKGMWENNQIILLERRVDKAAADKVKADAKAAAARLADERDAAEKTRLADEKRKLADEKKKLADVKQKEADDKKALQQKIETAKNERDKTIDYKNTLRQFFIHQLEIDPDPNYSKFDKGGSLSRMLYIDITANSFDYKEVLLIGKSANDVTKSGEQGKLLINTFVGKLNEKYERNKLSKYTKQVAAGLAEIKRVLDSNELKDQNNKVVAQLVITEFMENSNDTDSTLTENDAFLMRIKEITTRNNQLQQEFKTFKTKFKKTAVGKSEVEVYDDLLARADDIITKEIQKLYNSLRVIDNTKFTGKSVNTLFDQIKGLNDKVEKNYKELLEYDLSSLTAIRKQVNDEARARAAAAAETAEQVAETAEQVAEQAELDAIAAATKVNAAKMIQRAARRPRIQRLNSDADPPELESVAVIDGDEAAKEEEKVGEAGEAGDNIGSPRTTPRQMAPLLPIPAANGEDDDGDGGEDGNGPTSPKKDASKEDIEVIVEKLRVANDDSNGIFNEAKKDSINLILDKLIAESAGTRWFGITEFDKNNENYKKVLGMVSDYERLLTDGKKALESFKGNGEDIDGLRTQIGEYTTQYDPFKEKFNLLKHRIDHPQTDWKKWGSTTPRQEGGTRRGGKRFHKKTFKKKRFNRKTFKKKRFNRNTGNKKTFKKKTSNTKTGNNKTGNNKRFNNKTGNNKIVNKKTIRKNYFKRKQTHKK